MWKGCALDKKLPAYTGMMGGNVEMTYFIVIPDERSKTRDLVRACTMER